MPDKAQFLCFDIETRATTNERVIETIRNEVWAKSAPKSAKASVKAERDTEESREKRFEEAIAKTSVNPLYAEVLCAAWKTETEKDFVNVAGSTNEGFSLAAVSELLDEISSGDTLWIGHNIIGFDLPILLNAWRREGKTGIAPPANFPYFQGGRWRGNIADTMSMIPAKTPFTSLREASLSVGLGDPKAYEWRGEPMTGVRVAEAVALREYGTIAEYCVHDVDAEWDFFMRLTVGGTWGLSNARGALREELVAIWQRDDLAEIEKKVVAFDICRGKGLLPI